MPNRNGSNCERRDYQWDRGKSIRERDYSLARNRGRDSSPSAYRGYEFAAHQLDRRRKVEKRAVTSDFQTHVERWKSETMHLSSIPRRILHQSYLHIISLGYPVLPLLLTELRDRPDHWLVALNAITSEDPAPENATFGEAVQAWLKWGNDRGFC
jgi:hypothetical protein